MQKYSKVDFKKAGENSLFVKCLTEKADLYLTTLERTAHQYPDSILGQVKS